MIASQCVALHLAAMECRDPRPDPRASKLLRDGCNLARSMADLLVALDRKRGKGGQQVVRLDHVHVYPGGQAVLAVGEDAPGFAMGDLVGKPPETGWGEWGMTDNPRQYPTNAAALEQELGRGARLHTGWVDLQGASDA